jgi:hypothetical protein
MKPQILLIDPKARPPARAVSLRCGIVQSVAGWSGGVFAVA